MLTTIVIGTHAYSSDGTVYSGSPYATSSWASRNIFGLKLTLSDSDYSSIEFSAIGCGPAIPFVPGQPFKVFTSNDDGTSPVIRLAGALEYPQVSMADVGYAWGYRGNDLKWLADRVTLFGLDGSSPASFNLSTTDPSYLFNTAGQTVGEIVVALLQSPANAAALAGVGVGNYSVSGGIYTLPSTTAADLSALFVVPPTASLQGESALSTLEAFIQQWHPQFTIYVQADGTIRVVPVFGRAARTLTLPSGSVVGDPVHDLAYQGPDVSGCYAAVSITGLDIAWAVLSTKDGTLVPGWTMAQQSAWFAARFTSPTNTNDLNNAQDTGTIVSYTSTSVVVRSDSSVVHWDVNYWNSFGGVLVLVSTLADGGASISTTFTVKITSCTAMTPAGTATITWDASEAVTGSGFARYRAYAANTPLSLVGRAYLPATGSGSTLLTGRATWIGSHMEASSPFSFAWANVGKGADTVQSINYPACNVYWSANGQYPSESLPCPVDLDPENGQVILSQPSVFLSAQLAGQQAALASGFPATYRQGLYNDVEVALPYNRGSLTARSPASGFSGTAYTKYGVEYDKVLPLSSYTWKGNTAQLQQLAAEHLICYQDAVVTGSIRLHWDAWTPTFDVLSMPYSLRIVTPGAASEIDGLDLPVRSVTMEWPNSGPDIHSVAFEFSNKRRPFEGDDLYIHPVSYPQNWGTQDVFGGGEFAGVEGGWSDGLAGFQEPGIVPGVGGSPGVSDDEIIAMSGGPVADRQQPQQAPQRSSSPRDIANAGPAAAAKARKDARERDKRAVVDHDPTAEMMKRARASNPAAPDNPIAKNPDAVGPLSDDSPDRDAPGAINMGAE